MRSRDRKEPLQRHFASGYQPEIKLVANNKDSGVRTNKASEGTYDDFLKVLYNVSGNEPEEYDKM